MHRGRDRIQDCLD